VAGEPVHEPQTAGRPSPAGRCAGVVPDARPARLERGRRQRGPPMKLLALLLLKGGLGKALLSMGTLLLSG
jgi:hypothetical protein